MKHRILAPKFTAEYFSKLVKKAIRKVNLPEFLEDTRVLKRIETKQMECYRLVAYVSCIKRNPQEFAYLNEEIEGYREKLIEQLDNFKKQLTWCQRQFLWLKYGHGYDKSREEIPSKEAEDAFL